MRITDFLFQVRAIAAERPTYRERGDGSDGTCDCIGLIIGAIRRNGIRYTEIHGSNWFARHYTASLMRVTEAYDLSLGDLVYKARAPGAVGYDLPSRYAKDPDKYDYYHVGVVTGVDPLEITHCTSSGSVDGITMDSELGGWTHKGQLNLITYDTEEDVPVATTTAKVIAANGKPVNMRKSPSTTSALMDRVPVGAVVSVSTQQDGWARVSYDGKSGWMKAEFLRSDSADGLPGSCESVLITLPRDVAEQLLDALYSMLGRG